MSILDKISHKKEKAEESHANAVALCPHTVLIPRWDSADAIGHPERASEFVCEGCGTSMTPAEARALEASQADRLKAITAAATGEAHVDQ